MPCEEAVKIPLAYLTATAGLYEMKHLSLTFPTLEPRSTNDTLLVWGGGSNVGSAAIQLAILSGLRVVAIASKQHHELLKQAGASQAFESNSSNLVDQLVEHLRGASVVGAFNGMYIVPIHLSEISS